MVFAGQFGNAQHGDNVLEVFINREGLANFLGNFVVAFTSNVGHQHFRTGLQQIDGRIQAFTGTLARKRDGRGQVAEGVHSRGIGEIVRRNINGLDGRDRSGFGVADTFLKLRQLRGQRRLIPKP